MDLAIDAEVMNAGGGVASDIVNAIRENPKAPDAGRLVLDALRAEIKLEELSGTVRRRGKRT